MSVRACCPAGHVSWSALDTALRGSCAPQASEMHIEARELVRMRDYLSLVVSDATGQPYDRVSRGGEGGVGCEGGKEAWRVTEVWRVRRGVWRVRRIRKKT